VGAYIIRRLLGTLPTLAVLLLMVSVFIRLVPGSPVDLMLQESQATPAERHRLEHQLGLDVAVPRQIASYLGELANGSLGHSLWNRKTVVSQLRTALPSTIELSLLSMVVAVCFGVAIGVLGAVRRNHLEDFVSRSIALLFLSVPNFVLATALVILPARYFGWTPPLQYVALTDSPSRNVIFFVLPSLVLGCALSASLARFTRTTMLEVLRADYVRTARSKGLRELTVLRRYALRNALIPVVTVLGTQIAAVLGGAVVIEQVFGIPGVGRLMLDVISNRDYPVVQGIALVLGAVVVLANLIVDVAYTVLDPRIRYS
jgi:peptide/nickel transport system permease protein